MDAYKNVFDNTKLSEEQLFSTKTEPQEKNDKAMEDFAKKNAIIAVNSFISSQNAEPIPIFYQDFCGNWCYLETPKKGVLIGNIIVSNVTFLYIENKPKKSKLYVFIDYETNNIFCHTVLTLNEFKSGKIYKHFDCFYCFYPCTKKTAEQLIKYIISFSSKQFSQIYQLPGFYLFNELVGRSIKFISREFCPYIGKVLKVDNAVSKYVREKSLYQSGFIPQELNSKLQYLKQSNELMFLTAYRISGLLTPIYDTLLNINIKNILVVDPGENVSNSLLAEYSELLSVFSQSGNNQIGIAKRDITNILKNSYSETIIFPDYKTADAKRRNNAIKSIRSEYFEKKYYKKINLAFISNAVESFLESKDTFVLNTEGCDNLLSDAVCCTGYINDAVISHINNEKKTKLNNEKTILFMKEKVNKYNQEYKNRFSDYTYLDLFTSLMTSYELIISIIIPEIVSSDFESFLIKIIEKNLKKETAPFEVLDDFCNVLNNQLENSNLTLVTCNKHMNYSDDAKMVIVQNDFLSIRSGIFEKYIISNMNTADKLIDVQKSLKENGLLVCNKDLQNSLTVYDDSGKSVVKRFISFKYKNQLNSLLNDNNLRKLTELPIQDYFGGSDSCPEHFIPLIKNDENKIAGIKVGQSETENKHIFVSGCSKQESTYFLCRLMYSMYENKEKIVVFDTNNSFNEKSLTKYISEEFVNRHMDFYNTDDCQIPVNIWDISPYQSHIERKNYISALISSVLRTITKNQKMAINKAISTVLNNSDSNRVFDVNEFVEILRKDNNPNIIENIADTIENISEDLNQYDINNGLTWEEILSDDTITVISLPYHTDNSSNIVDMFLASLWMYQKSFANDKIKIFIDEIESQNLETKGPINAILTEGSDYKIGFVFASKTVSDKIISRNAKKNNISLAVYFKPDEASKNAVINILDLDKDKQEIMERFSFGNCFIKGNVYNFRTGVNEKAVIYGKVIKKEY
ncbi:MAG: hypothetical protein PUC88_04605 [Clostridia bacterium]|nr:hypothetical protein [Clostridia bacterium]